MSKINKIAFGRQGQFGDLAMNQPSFDVLRELYPEASLCMTVNKKYKDIVPLFYNQPNINGFFIADGYDDFPTDLDRRNASAMQFDEFYNPMIPHIDGEDWFKRRHQVKDVAFCYNLPECDDKINLVKYWGDEEKLNNTVAFCPFGAYGAPHKSLTSDQIYSLIYFFKKQGYDVLQLCNKTDSTNYFSAIKNSNTSFIDSVKLLHRCKFLVTVDTAMCWIASAYNIPTVALYSHSYYSKEFVKNIQPINPNSQYLSDEHISKIKVDKIVELIKLINT